MPMVVGIHDGLDEPPDCKADQPDHHQPHEHPAERLAQKQSDRTFGAAGCRSPHGSKGGQDSHDQIDDPARRISRARKWLDEISHAQARCIVAQRE